MSERQTFEWTCPACGEVYPEAVKGIAERCLADINPMQQGDNWPPHTRHHWPTGLPESSRNAWFWYEVRRRQIEEGLTDDR